VAELENQVHALTAQLEFERHEREIEIEQENSSKENVEEKQDEADNSY
jgi:hypothetical protein